MAAPVKTGSLLLVGVGAPVPLAAGAVPLLAVGKLGEGTTGAGLETGAALEAGAAGFDAGAEETGAALEAGAELAGAELAGAELAGALEAGLEVTGAAEVVGTTGALVGLCLH